MPIINIKQFNINSLRKQFSFEILFTLLIILGIPLNLYQNRFYDNSWTVGEWLNKIIALNKTTALLQDVWSAYV